MVAQFIVSARKYRPSSFGELLGQDAISLTLRRAISQNKTAHAYLFCGPRGVGKTSAARIFAKTINCMHPTDQGEACGECESCMAFDEQRSLNIFELDAASNNSTEDIRRLIAEVTVPPQFGRFKVYIIDEVHMLSQSAFNAFLKTLEEPPSYVVFILATTEKQKILPTILSRCQVYDFKPISNETIQQQLERVAGAEGIVADSKALELIAQQADGGMRDALSLFDRLAGFGNGSITYEETIASLHILNDSYYLRLAEYIYNNDVSAILYLLDEVINKGFDPKTILLGLQSFFRKLMLAADNTTLPMAKLSPEEVEPISKIALDLGRPFLYQALLQLGEAEKRYRTSAAKRLLVEMTLIGFTSLSRESSSLSRNRGTASPATKATSVAVSTSEKNNASNPTSRSPLSPKEPARRLSSSIVQLKKKSSLSEPPSRVTDDEVGEVPPTAELEGIRNSIELNEENLKQVWNQFVDNEIQPTQRIEKALVQGRTPILSAETTVQVAVGSRSQMEILKKMEPRIVSFLQNQFANPAITLEILFSETEEKTAMQSRSEWFAGQLAQNNALKELHDKLHLRDI